MTEQQRELAQRIRAHPQRFRRRHKEQFLQFLEGELGRLGFPTQRTEGRNLLRCINLESSNDDVDLVLLAHYDTPTILPPVFEPLVRLTGHTRQLLMLAVFFAILTLFSIFEDVSWVPVVESVFWLSFLTLLIPNPRNLNDNTSGVLGLLFLAEKISRDEKLRERVKFVFLDNEENGLLGAGLMRDRWRRRGFRFDRLPILSLDCIGRGQIPVVVRNGKAPAWGERLLQHLRTDEPEARYLDMAFLPINDNFVFRREGALVVTMMNPSWLPGGYYIDNIHTPLDNDFDPAKIDWVAERVWRFMVESPADDR